MGNAFDASYAAGGMADSLEDIIKQKFLQQIEARRAMEAQQKIALDTRQVGQGDRRLGLDEQQFGEGKRQFDISSGQAGERLKMDQELQPVKLRHMGAQADDLERQPQEALDQRSFAQMMADLTHKHRLGEIGATGANAVRVANIRQPTGLNPNQAMTQTRALQNDYRKVTGPASEMQRQLGLMDQGLEAARRGDLNAGSQAVLVTFQKILDPTSVVRESEYARSPEGLGLMQKIQGVMPRIMQGGPGVPPAELEKFAALARQMTEGVTRNAQASAQSIIDLATANGIDPKLVTGGSAPAGAGTSGAKPTAADLLKKYGGG